MKELTLRDLVKGAYPGCGWSKKVDNMSSKQVTAIYFRLLEQDKDRLMSQNPDKMHLGEITISIMGKTKTAVSGTMNSIMDSIDIMEWARPVDISMTSSPIVEYILREGKL